MFKSKLRVDKPPILYIMYIYNIGGFIKRQGDFLDIIIANNSDIPIYQQIEEQIKNMIVNGQLAAGSPLPSIRNLAVQLRISSITTKRAYDELEKAGYIISQVGRGSFVNGQNKELLHEKRLQIVEEKLLDAVNSAKIIGMAKTDLLELLEILYEEGS